MGICRALKTGAYEDLSPRSDWPTLADFDLGGRVPICVGAGPSLDLNSFDLRRADRSKFAIIATDAALRHLVHRGIRPDAVVSSELEGAGTRKNRKPGTEPLIWGIETSTYRLPLFAPYTCNISLLELWQGPVFYYVDAGWKYRKWWDMAPSLWPGNAADALVVPQFLSVGGHAIACCEHLGATEIVLIGYDWQHAEDLHHCTGYSGQAPEEAHRKALEDMHRRWQNDGGKWTKDESIKITNCTAFGRYPADMPLIERLLNG